MQQVWFQNRRAAFKKKRKLSAMVQLRAGAASHSQMTAQQSAQLSQQLAFFGATAAGGAMPLVSAAAAGMGVGVGGVGACGQSGQPNDTQLLYQMSQYNKSSGAVPLATQDYVSIGQKAGASVSGCGGGGGAGFGMGMGMAAAWPHLLLAPSMDAAQISAAACTGAQTQTFAKTDRSNSNSNNNNGGGGVNSVQQEYLQRSQSYVGGDTQNLYSIAAADSSAAHRRPPQQQQRQSPPTLLSLVAPQNDSPHSRRQMAPAYADTGIPRAY